VRSDNLRERAELAVQGSIRKSRLHRHPYTISLMNEGLRAGLLTSQELMRIQNGFMQILQELIQRHTRGESTSVTTDTAENILASVMYAADAYLFSFEQPERAITYLKAIDIRQVYTRGVEKVSQCYEQSKQLYKEIRATKLDVPVDAYNMTIDESLPIFLRKYGIIFDAHHTMASIDYPLAMDDMNLQGVYYIRQYLERLKLENTFCAMYDPQALLNLLTDYGRVCRFDYRIELYNMYELVLSQAVFSVMSGGDALDVRLSENQYLRLEQQLTALTEAGIRSAVTEAIVSLQRHLAIESQHKEYMDGCTDELVQRVAHAAKHNSLRTVILTEKEAVAKSIVISFSEADRMSDAELRSLLHEVMSCDRAEEKVRLILTRFKSFHDYLDMLESDCLYGDEYVLLFEAFGNTELAILAKIVFYEELRGESLDMTGILEQDNDYPMEWQKQFASSLRGMKQRLLAIDKLIDEIDYDQITFY